MAMKTRSVREILFATPGEVIEGRLMRFTPVRYRDGGSNVEYIMRRTSGEIVFFKGSSMLNKLLFKDDVGKLAIVKYVGLEAKDIPDGMSPKKLFEVSVDDDSKIASLEPSAKAAPNASDSELHITDDDIPF